MAPHKPSDAARATLTGLGVAGAALTLCLAAAAPALADRPDSPGSNGKGHQQNSSTTNGDSAGTTNGTTQGKDDSHGKGQGKGHSNAGASEDSTAQDSTAQDHADQAPAGDASSPHGNSHSAAASGTNGHNPPGNNGTVFIHDVAGDFSPHNVPHVGCTFYADFFGFDNGQQVTVSFAGQAPTGMGTALGGSWTGTVSTDDAGGAGNDFDLEKSFTADQLGVSALGAPAHEGYHVKMTVLTGQPGPNNKKSKVFWIQPCDTATAPAVAGSDNSAAGTSDTTTGAVGSTGQENAGADTQAAGGVPTDVPTDVLGESFTKGASPAAAGGAVAPAASSLPFTGAEIGGMAAAAAAAIAGGLALTVAGRRRRSARLTTGS